ncbi:transposase [Mucilaginibacter sp. AW1-7]
MSTGVGGSQDQLEERWGKKYEKVLESWRNNWSKLTTYFKYDTTIRKLIYTPNIIEGFRRQVRKVTKTKGGFISDMALLKLIYVAHNNSFVVKYNGKDIYHRFRGWFGPAGGQGISKTGT